MGPGMGQGLPGGPGPGGAGGSGASMFSAQDVATMNPNEVQLYQELGLLPPGMQLPQAMEEQQPGILQQISEELKEYFDYLKVTDEESQVQPAEITPADEKLQQEKWKEAEHQESLAETVVNRRRIFGPPLDQSVRKQPERGKYPRSGGRFVDDQKEQVKPQKIGRTRKNYRPGKNNPYV